LAFARLERCVTNEIEVDLKNFTAIRDWRSRQRPQGSVAGRVTKQKFVILGALAALSLPGLDGAQDPQPAPPGQAHTLAPPNSPSPPPEQIRPANT
jgi:hypothetical protein